LVFFLAFSAAPPKLAESVVLVQHSPGWSKLPARL